MIAEYIKLTILHGEFIQDGNDKSANKIHSKIRSLVKRIRESDSEVKNEFYKLLTHPNSSVRLWTAIELIGTDPEKSKGVLEEIQREKEVIGLTASSLLKMWKDGLIKKTDWKKPAHNTI
ncbi:hypothetical protein [Cyclobacterium plantarum]|uniref:hypothetical protein n=1 Tax=Cyclobacterium plantarum TaxID=2716263 RepID=UPI003F725FAD